MLFACWRKQFTRLKFILNSIKNVHVPLKPQRIISATRGWEFLFCEDRQNHVFFRSTFQSTLLKHAGEVFLVKRNADFFKLKNASEISWWKVLLIRVLYREQIMLHGWSVTLTYCYRLYGLSAFSNRYAVLQKLSVAAKKEIWNSCEYQFNVKIWKLRKTWKYKNLRIKNIKSRNYTYNHKISWKALHHFTASQLHR